MVDANPYVTPETAERSRQSSSGGCVPSHAKSSAETMAPEEEVSHDPKSAQPSLRSIVRAINELIVSQQWEALVEVLTTKNQNKKGEGIFTEFHVRSFARQMGGQSLLHVVCRHQPPVEVVELLLAEWPFLSNYVDPKMMQTALHVAAKHGARSDVVKSLIRANGGATSHPDAVGRLPLHWACCPRIFRGEDENSDTLEQDEEWINPGSAVIKALCDDFPRATNIEDSHGCNPLELAFTGESHVGKKVFSVLMDTSVEDWKSKLEEITDEERKNIDLSFSLPGYTPSAAEDLLIRCRCNRSKTCNM